MPTLPARKPPPVAGARPVDAKPPAPKPKPRPAPQPRPKLKPERAMHALPRNIRELYEQMRTAWLERPTAQHVRHVVPEVSAALVRVAIEEGFPALGLPPLSLKDLDAINVEMRRIRQNAEAQDEAMRRQAEEAAAARIGVAISLKAAQAVGALADRIMYLIDRKGLVESVEEVTPRLLSSLARMTELTTAALERSVKLQRLHAGEPEQLLGVQVGLLLENCTEEEFEYVSRTGRLPSRVLGFLGPGDRHVIDVQPVAPSQTAADAGASAGAGAGANPAADASGGATSSDAGAPGSASLAPSSGAAAGSSGPSPGARLADQAQARPPEGVQDQTEDAGRDRRAPGEGCRRGDGPSGEDRAGGGLEGGAPGGGRAGAGPAGGPEAQAGAVGPPLDAVHGARAEAGAARSGGEGAGAGDGEGAADAPSGTDSTGSASPGRRARLIEPPAAD